MKTYELLLVSMVAFAAMGCARDPSQSLKRIRSNPK